MHTFEVRGQMCNLTFWSTERRGRNKKIKMRTRCLCKGHMPTVCPSGKDTFKMNFAEQHKNSVTQSRTRVHSKDSSANSYYGINRCLWWGNTFNVCAKRKICDVKLNGFLYIVTTASFIFKAIYIYVNVRPYINTFVTLL